MKYKINILIGLLLLSVYGCNNDDDSNGNEQRFFWNQTKCADPWSTGENNSKGETEIAVTKYLQNENVNILNLSFDTNSPLAVDCESCGCGTGQRIIVNVKDSDVSKMKELNFYQ